MPTSSGTGDWNAVLTGPPTSSDPVVIADGHTVTVPDGTDAACSAISVNGTGRLIVATGGTFTLHADSLVPGDTADTAARITVEAGGILQADPTAGAIRLQLGTSGQDTRRAQIRLAGASGNPAILRRKPGTTGRFAVTCPDYNNAMPWTGSYNPIDADHFEITGLAELTLATYTAGSRITLTNGTIDLSQADTTANAKPFHLTAYLGGVYTIEDVRFTGGSGQVLTLDLIGDTTAGTSTFRRVVVEQATSVVNTQGTNACGLDVSEPNDNVFLGQIGASDSGNLNGFLSGAFCYATADEQGTNTWNLGGAHEAAYLFMDYGETDPTQGNPHFIFAVSTLTLTNAIFDFRGGGGADIGDCIDGGTFTAKNPIILLATRTDGGTGSLASGSFWTLGEAPGPVSSIGRMTVECGTIFATGVRSGIGFPHTNYNGDPDRVRVSRTLVCGTTDEPAALVFADYGHTEDTLDLATFQDNAGWRLGTYNNNTIGGVSDQTLKGFTGIVASEAPTYLDLDASGGPQFFDAGRNFLRWAEEVRNHTGTDAEIIAAGIADIVADPTLTRLSLLPWVRAGYRPQNALLYDAGRTDDALSGRWIGAVSGDEPAATLVIRGNDTSPVNCANLYEVYPAESVAWSVVSGDATIDADTGMLVTGGTAGSVVIRADGATAYGEHTLTVHDYDVPELGMTGPFAALIGLDPNPDYVAADHITPALGDRPLLPSLGPLADLTTPSRHLPVSPYDAAIMEFFRTGDGTVYGLKAGDAMDFRWGSNGMALNVVDSTTQAAVELTYIDADGGYTGTDLDIFHSDPADAWPIPDDARTQSNPTTTPVATVDGDAHLLVLDRETGHLFEAYHVSKTLADGWRADNGWVIDTATGDWAPHVTDDTDPHYVTPGGHRFPAVIVTAAGLPIAPLCVRYEEVYVHGIIRHRLGFTMNNVKIGGTWVWPGRGMAYMNIARWVGEWGPTIPYAATLRLSADWYHDNVEAADGTPVGTWGEGSRVILRCLYDYGMMLTDGGGVGDFWAIADSRYHEEGHYANDLVDLNNVPLGAFEVVDWGEPMVTLAVDPATADIGVQRELSITYHGWEQYPGVEHPGNSDAEETHPVYGWQIWPWQWLAWPAHGTATPAQFATAKAGEPAHPDGRSVEIDAAHPTALFTWTPDVADREWWPVFNGYGPHWDYHLDGPTVIATTAEPEPEPAVGGGMSRRRKLLLLTRGAF